MLAHFATHSTRRPPRSSSERLAEEALFDRWILAAWASDTLYSNSFLTFVVLSTGSFSAVPLYYLDSGAWDVGSSVAAWRVSRLKEGRRRTSIRLTGSCDRLPESLLTLRFLECGCTRPLYLHLLELPVITCNLMIPSSRLVYIVDLQSDRCESTHAVPLSCAIVFRHVSPFVFC
jgi:hypothetical protein